MIDSDWDIPDPLSINFHRQTSRLLEAIPTGSVYAAALRGISSRSDILPTLSHLLAQPSLTLVVATHFRPLLLDLCARWLDADHELEEKFEAFGLLIEIHEELYPVLSHFLRRPCFANGPLTLVSACTSVSDISTSLLHRLLLAYYRILRANRFLPRDLLWNPALLSTLFWLPHSDRGVCWLAIRCYALQTGMGDAEREGLEKQVLGNIGEADCQIAYGENIAGVRQEVDGWMLPLLEVKRIKDSREITPDLEMYHSCSDDQSQLSTDSRDLSSWIVNIHGILLHHIPLQHSPPSPLITTPSAIISLRKLAVHVSLRLPTLLTSSPSSGKSVLLDHLASRLYPSASNQIVTIHLADTSLDPRSLLGSYTSSPTKPGTFEWRDGVLVRAMHEGKWLVLKDIDRGSSEVLGLITPLIESFDGGKRIGARASIEVPGRSKVEAAESFMLFATRSLEQARHDTFAMATFLNAHKWSEVVIPSPTMVDLRMILDAKFPKLAGAVVQSLIHLWQAVKDIGSTTPARVVGLRDLETFCTRVSSLLPSSYMSIDVDMDVTPSDFSLSMAFPNPTLREDIYLEARDVFFGAGSTNEASKVHRDRVAASVAELLGLSPERRDWVLQQKAAEFEVEKDVDGRLTAIKVGGTRLLASPAKPMMDANPTRPFTMHRPAMQLLSRIATCISLREPVLLTGETGTGKTSLITHVASLLNRPLVSLNLSTQTESSDLIGGFKPIDALIPGLELQQRFVELFGRTFSRKKNGKFEDSIRKAVADAQWKKATKLWTEAARLAIAKLRENADDSSDVYTKDELGSDLPRKRQKLQHQSYSSSKSDWTMFEQDVHTFEIQHVQNKGRFSFAFVEGPLVKALRLGAWVLLDEINLASPETLECISGILQGPTSSITLTEQGSLEPVPRHSDFHLFACMNPATDVGKKDLPPHLRTHFTEIEVPSPDADRETLLSIITQYIGHCAVSDKAAVLDVAEFYTAAKNLTEARQIADGSNHRPHYSIRTLTRALTFTSDTVSVFGLRRALWEGCLMAFTMVLDAPSAEIVSGLARKHLLSVVKNTNSLLSQVPSAHQVQHLKAPVQFGPFWLETGPLELDNADNYILTPSVQRKLIDLARIIFTRRVPLLIEGPTSSGKTSAVEYLARRTGHRFVRINNHEHTDIQEYIGTYVSDPNTGKLVFQDGLLVRALRRGDWIVLDELNLAPTDVLEALNRLLDDNRELLIPETHEVVRPHPHFMLFATQNPPGVYAGRKILSRAFRNRFLEVHFDDVPQTELEAILCQRCRIAPSYGQRIVAVFRELQHRRQSGRVFEGRHGFATLRDLFRWAQRDAVGYQELAENGYMLLAERARSDEDKKVVKEVIEKIMNVVIDEGTMYNIYNSNVDMASFLDCPIPSHGPMVWTGAMQRLFILVARALRFNEPVLLVGETGCGKTSVCQVYADSRRKRLHTVNCHQNIEAADLIGGQRPVRHQPSTTTDVLQEALSLLSQAGLEPPGPDVNNLVSALESWRKTLSPSSPQDKLIFGIQQKLQSSSKLFEWHDGPLINCMRSGDVFLLDEISLADDSVLERLNSVLEPSRTIVLAERGGDDVDYSEIAAVEDFKLISTMNPGGDYGKKELSPALRNRFTEIWVPSVVQRSDLEQIVGSMWQHAELQRFTVPLLDFTEWLCSRVRDRSVASLRDILAWVSFCNVVFGSSGMSPELIFNHGARMTFLDGLASFPQLSGWPQEALQLLREQAMVHLETLVCLPAKQQPTHVLSSQDAFMIGLFSIPKGACDAEVKPFSLDAPTSQDNAMRVIRACQLTKPILLEGSPGVGKTSLVAALANAAGHRLSRINLSDQTDLVDLFGSDLPVEGSRAGEFAWKDAIFLEALQNGDWVLLDEMNLAPQSVLEGLNSVLDHRGTVYIPELGRSFTRHPNFRIFAAQNPLHQGGGRKGLPKSFVNRFTKVHVETLTPNDMLLICCHLFPDLPTHVIQSMIRFNSVLHEQVTVKRIFGREGSPWEFNLRDIIRWSSLLQKDILANKPARPEDYADIVYTLSFRQETDREHVRKLLRDIFGSPNVGMNDCMWPSTTATYFQCGRTILARGNNSLFPTTTRLVPAQLPSLQAALTCTSQNWLVILTGPQKSGKTSLVRSLANLCGHPLRELSLNSATDTTDLLGSFEQVDNEFQTCTILYNVLRLSEKFARTMLGSQPRQCAQLQTLKCALGKGQSSLPNGELLQIGQETLDALPASYAHSVVALKSAIESILANHSPTGRFEWVDGPLVQAMKSGQWLLLDGVNLCNSSVLDRLNSLCEAGGSLVLSEKGDVPIALSPHPNFRLFMTVNPRYGELSRAMRNRGIEISLSVTKGSQSIGRLLDAHRLPASISNDILSISKSSVAFELSRRALLSDLRTDFTAALWPSSDLAIEDSLCSFLFECSSLLTQHSPVDRDASILTLIRLSLPAYPQHLRRLACSLLTSNSGVLNRLLQVISCQPNFLINSVVYDLRQEYERKDGETSYIVQSQPLDMFLNPVMLDERQPLQMRDGKIMRLYLETFVRLALYEHDSSLDPQSAIDLLLPTSSTGINDQMRRGQQEAVDFLACLVKNIRGVLRFSVNEGKDLVLHSLQLSVNLLNFAMYLREVITSPAYDFSAVYTLANWIDEALEDPPLVFGDVKKHSIVLRRAAGLSSGHGIFDIWSALFRRSWPTAVRETFAQLDSAMSTSQLSGIEKSRRLRARALELLASQTFDQTSSTTGSDMAQLITDIETHKALLPINVEDSGVIHSNELPILAAELKALSCLSSLPSARVSEESVEQMQFLISVACQSFGTNLTRFVAYQHTLWRCKAGDGRLPDLADIHVRWLKALWNETSSVRDIYRGPSALVSPMLLRSTQTLCQWDEQSLEFSGAYAANLHDSVTLALSERNHRSGRLQQIIALLIQSALMICACFPNAFDGPSLEILRDLSMNQDLGSIASTIQLSTSLSHCVDGPLRSLLLDIFVPALNQLSREGQLPHQRQRDIGMCWLALSRMIMNLYIPDIPIDPTAVQECKAQFWRRRENWIYSQIQSLKLLEDELTGNDSSPAIRQLDADLLRIRQEINTLPKTILNDRMQDVSHLYGFWGEIRQFTGEVVSEDRLDHLLASLDEAAEDSHLREEMVQDSIAGFLQRMSTAYATYADMMLPVEMALLQLRFGLRLIRQAETAKLEPLPYTFIPGIVAFPSTAVATSLRTANATSALDGSIRPNSLILRLSSLAYESSLGVNLSHLLGEIDDVYEQVTRLWLIDCAKNDEKEQRSTSLYRRKRTDHDVIDESELEEREFKLLFPTYEETDDDESVIRQSNLPSVMHEQEAQQDDHMAPSRMLQIFTLHMNMFNAGDRSKSISLWKELRHQFVEALLSYHPSLPSTLDEASLPYRLGLLRQKHQAFQQAVVDKSYDFYVDANVVENRKAVAVLNSLRNQLELLIEEWPEQMVLRHLKDRCNRLLSQPLQSPVAKVLTGLEQLLVHTEDWEIYANRDNSLKHHQQALTSLIIEWRRLELSGWQQLLTIQDKAFTAGMSEWWFRLYDVAVRGSSAAAQTVTSPSFLPVDDYLDKLIPLLDDFISNSSLGQYKNRMDLLQSFGLYVSHLAETRTELTAMALKRTAAVLSSVVRYYGQFSARVDASLSDQRAAIQKEIVGFIKLASWKDVNVQALQQSARHTHRQLYKNIRKFRDVLRQPITPFLRLDGFTGFEETNGQQTIRQVAYLNEDHVHLRAFIKSGTVHSSPAHPSNLAITFSKFTALLSTDMQGLVASTSALCIEDLATCIILAVKELANPSPPRGGDEGKWHKSLLVRKRKSWSDLLKELKRIGISSNVKPDTLRKQMDRRWLLELPPLAFPGLQSSEAIEKSEAYFCRILGTFPELRRSLSNHHPDMATRELQRGVMFLESALSIALRSRSRLAATLRAQRQLQNIMDRLQMIASLNGPFMVGNHVLHAISAVMDKCCRTIDAIEEAINGCEDVMDLSSNTHAISAPTLNDLRECITRTKNIKAGIASVLQKISLTNPPVISRNEEETVQLAIKHFDDIMSFLREIIDGEPAIHHLTKPIYGWLASQSCNIPASHYSQESEEVLHDSHNIIEVLLVVVQDLRVQNNQAPSDPSDDSENHLRDNAILLDSIGRTLKIDIIIKQLELFLAHLPGCSKSSISDALSQLLPFLNQYVMFLNQHVSGYEYWNKALFKLVFILGTVMARVSTDGFCKPPDMDETEDKKENAEISEGVGFGQGSGTDNISGEVEEESQVEGLKGDDNNNDHPKNEDDDNAVEMSQDVGGDLEDAPENDSGDEDSPEDEGDVDMDEELGQGKDSDLAAVDEKFWKDEKEEQQETGMGTQGRSSTEQTEMAAKDGHEKEKPKRDPPADAPTGEEDSAPENASDNGEASETEGEPQSAGAPMEDHVSDEQHLDLPDNMDLGQEDDLQEQQHPEEELLDQMDSLPEEFEDSSSIDAEMQENEEFEENGDLSTPPDGDDPMPDDSQSASALHADLKSGDNLSAQSASNALHGDDLGDDGHKGSNTDLVDSSATDETLKESERDERMRENDTTGVPQGELGTSGSNTSSLQHGPAPSLATERHAQSLSRSLGDSSKDVRQHYDEIQAPPETEVPRVESTNETTEVTPLEYVQPDENSDMQALGPSGEEQVAKLSELHLLDSDEKVDARDHAMEIDTSPASDPRLPATSNTFESHGHEGETKFESEDPENEARPNNAVARNAPGVSDDQNLTSLPSSPINDSVDPQQDVETELRQWRLQGQPDSDAANIWHMYESLTHSLAYALCEQLRLILEPTMATRLRGDYRTGKRLNMKKIIPYIASEYTKDKIWLRRTRPSQREYQILVALDDSRSMAESHSIHLAYETLALVSKALNVLEAGDISIARFGETVDVLHDFESGPLTDQAGAKVLNAFHFDQKATNVLSLLETSLKVLADARDRRSIRSSSAAELWQLQIIISDGICQDHDKLRSVLRRAEEQRVLIVFIVIDALKSDPSGEDVNGMTGVSAQNSILQMNQVTYKNVNGRLELQMQRYLDSFPFEYFVVLSSVEALPDILSSTLKQFFERISEY